MTLNLSKLNKRLTVLKELQVKGRRCPVTGPQEQKIRIWRHWLLHDVADEDVQTVLAVFSKVTEVTRERWRAHEIHVSG